MNLLGKREPLLYGSESFEEYFGKLKEIFSEADLSYKQVNEEGELVEAIHGGADFDAVVLNPAAFTHTSIAVGDAVAAIQVPVIEVHISNVFSREVYRHHSFVSKYASAVVVGAGLDGYRMAIDHALRL